jgi:hypothetical protein
MALPALGRALAGAEGGGEVGGAAGTVEPGPGNVVGAVAGAVTGAVVAVVAPQVYSKAKLRKPGRNSTLLSDTLENSLDPARIPGISGEERCIGSAMRWTDTRTGCRGTKGRRTRSVSPLMSSVP